LLSASATCLIWGAFTLPQDAAKKDAAKKDEAEKKPSAPTAKSQLEALQKELQALSQELAGKFRAAKTQEEKNAIRDQFFKARSDFAPKYLAVAEEHPKDPASLEASAFVVMYGKDSKQAERAIGILTANHLADERLSELLTGLASSDSAVVEGLFKAVIEKATKKELKGQASLALAQNLRARAEKAAADKKPDADQLLAAAEKQYDAVITSYKDVESVVETARDALFELKHLAIGRVAPETEGQDSDGRKFKLSDYRGKVVVIDFWAGW
jgi:hypothetical protein